MSKYLAAIIVGSALLTGCSADVEGTWMGTWTSSGGGGSEELLVTLRQSGSDLSGGLTRGPSCLAGAEVEGSATSDEVTLVASSGDDRMTLTGKVDSDNSDKMTGTYQIAGSGSCSADSGAWELTRR
jgi:hypothetical protein